MPILSPHRCYVVIYEGSYSSMGTPDEVYYEGESEEEGERARAAAQAVVDKSREAYPTLHHKVYSLDEYISAKSQDAQYEGERRAQGSDF
jgi:hypothetical protein